MSIGLTCYKQIAAVAFGLLAGTQSLVASGAPQQALNIAVVQGSIQIDGIELRSDQSAGTLRYISLSAAEKALGRPQDTYVAGLGVRVYAWPSVGIHLQRGWRGSEKGKIFKFQVWFDDSYDKAEHKHSGRFHGHLHLEGLDISPETGFDSIRGELQKLGYHVPEYQSVISAEKGEIQIFTVGTTNKIERVEAWCLR
jgi:hypothetical protein